MPDWKRTERRVAQVLGGRRVPVTGRARGDAPDVAHPTLSIECKERKAIPGWLHSAMAQAEASAAPGQTAIAVLHETGTRHARSFVVVRLDAFVRLTGQNPDGGH